MVRQRRHLTQPEVRLFILQIFGATKYLHENGIIHGELTLANILLDQSMTVKLVNFLSRTRPPNNEGKTYENDIRSIGVVMYPHPSSVLT
jgi:serine/threonine protein kinase